MKRKFCHLTVAGLLIAMLLTLFPTTSFAVGFSSGGAMLSVLEYPSPEEIVFLSECDDVNVSEWYALGSPADLRKLSTLVNNGTTSYLTLRVYMTNSIDMTGESFTPIGSSLQTLTKEYFNTKFFNGIFDGRGFVIDGLNNPTVENTTTKVSYTSLFGIVGEGATIRNLVIGRNCSFTSSTGLADSCAASLASRVIEGATIRNILNLAPVSGAKYSGGIVARVDTKRSGSAADMTLWDCTNMGSVSGSVSAGGLIGSVQGQLYAQDCRNLGTVSGSGSVGGLFGLADKGLAYQSRSTTIRDMTDCIQNGTVTGTDASRTGGFFGWINQTDDSVSLSSFSDCSCYGSVSSGQPFCGNLTSYYGAPDAILPGADAELTAAKVQGVQMKQSGSVASVRFIGSIDDPEQYGEVGFVFDVAHDGKTDRNKKFTCSTVFQSLHANKGGDVISYTAEQLRGSSGSLFAVTFNGIPVSGDGEISFSVKAYTVDKSDTEQVTSEYSVRLVFSDGKAVLTK